LRIDTDLAIKQRVDPVLDLVIVRRINSWSMNSAARLPEISNTPM
jgi:hypothetical protein